jgi:hypothetical protein
MTVAELITLLQTKPQELQVVYQLHSEYCLLEANLIDVERLCEPRPDGWVHDARPDKPTQEYLVLPGN